MNGNRQYGINELNVHDERRVLVEKFRGQVGWQLNEKLKYYQSVQLELLEESTKKKQIHVTRSVHPPRDYGKVEEHSNQLSLPVLSSKREYRLESNSTEKKEDMKKYKLELKGKLVQSKRILKTKKEMYYGEPRKRFTYRDFMLKEMEWMQIDFRQECCWKRSVMKQVSMQAANKIGFEEKKTMKELKLKAMEISTQIGIFWRSMERVAARNRLRYSDTKKKVEVGMSNGVSLKKVDMKLDSCDEMLPRHIREILEKMDRLEEDSKFMHSFSRGVVKKIPEFQMNGLEWMVNMMDNGIPMILNDQFGLGEASQIGLLLSYFRKEHMQSNLIVAQGSRVHKYIHYVKQWCPMEKIHTKIDQEGKMDTMVVDYNTFMMMVGYFHTSSWEFLVADIDDINMNAKLWKMLNRIKANRPKILVSNKTPNSFNAKVEWLDYLGISASSDMMKHHRIKGENASVATILIQKLSIRRLRTAMENQFFKIDEQPIPSTLTSAQCTMYRDYLSNPVLLDSVGNGGLSTWLQLVLKLRGFCNGVEILGCDDKLGLADIKAVERYSAKCAVLGKLLKKLVHENKRIVVYAQMGDVLELIEYYVGLLGLNSVRVTGTLLEQQNALVHFAMKPNVQVAIMSTRCAAIYTDLDGNLNSNTMHAATAFGANAVIVFDSDWDPLVDAKLRVAWQHLTLLGDLPVYRMHCEGTIETTLLRSGSCITEKLFKEVSAKSFIRGNATGHMTLFSVENIPHERPSWWHSIKSNELFTIAGEVGDVYNNISQLKCGLKGSPYSELDDDEHLLLSNTDELLPIEWYAVNVVQCEADVASHRLDTDCTDKEASHGTSSLSSPHETTSSNDDTLSDFFYNKDNVEFENKNAELNHYMNEQLSIRAKGLADYALCAPPQSVDGYVHEKNVHDVDNKIGCTILFQRGADKQGSKKTKVDAHGNRIKQTKLKKKLTKEQKENLPKKRKSTMTPEEKAAMKRQRLQAAAAADAFSTNSVVGHSLGDSDDDYLMLDPNSLGFSDLQQKSSKLAGMKKMKFGSSKKARKLAASEISREAWTVVEDGKLLKLHELYGDNWNIICFLLNQAITSYYGSRLRSGRQCNERYIRLTNSSQNKNLKQKTCGISPKKLSASGITDAEEAFYTPKYHSNGMLMYYPKTLYFGVPPPSIDHIKPLVVQWKEEKLGLEVPSSFEKDNKSMSLCFGHVMHAMRNKRPAPSIPGTEGTNKSGTIVRAHISHAQATGCSDTTNGTTLSPEQVIEKSKQAAIASKEITGKDSVPGKHGGTTYGSTLQAISAKVSGSGNGDDDGRKSKSPALSKPNATGSSIGHAGTDPVTTSTLLYVIDRIPGVKTQIQQVLQRTDRTEPQKVEMIARLLKSTKATNPSPALSSASPEIAKTQPEDHAT